jgi:hypothetical protein
MKKLKICTGDCGKLSIIWKSHEGLKFCKTCWFKYLNKTSSKPTIRQKKLPPRSPKRILQEAEYSAQRKIFLNKNPMCQMHLPGICTQHASDVHHMKGRIGDLLLDEQFWKAGCRACHSWVELNPFEAKEMGLSLSRN